MMARPIYEGKRIRLKSNGKNFLWVRVRNVAKDDSLSVARRDGSLLATGKVIQPTVKNNGVTLPYAKLQLSLIRTLAPAPVQDEVIPVTITLTNASGEVIIEDEIIIDDVDPTITSRKKPGSKAAKITKAAAPKVVQTKVKSKKISSKKAAKKVAPKKKSMKKKQK